jgi:cation:H+ antiporter
MCSEVVCLTCSLSPCSTSWEVPHHCLRGRIRAIEAVDIALGNLFGSNLFNIGILALDDLLYTKGALVSHISGDHLVAILAAISMTAIAIIGLTYQTTRRLHVFAWDSIGIVIVYVSATLILYATGH